jgi:hypothetical protein
MCEPISMGLIGSAVASSMAAVGTATAAMGGAGVIAGVSAASAGASALVGHMGATQQAKDQNAAYSANAYNAITAYQGDIEANNLNTMTAQEAATQRRFGAQQEGLAARGASRASSGERGMGGLSAAALQRDLGFQQGQNIAAINRNSELDQNRSRLTARGAQDGTQSRINSAQRSRGPNLLALGADLAGVAANGFTMRSNLRANAAAGTG